LEKSNVFFGGRSGLSASFFVFFFAKAGFESPLLLVGKSPSSSCLRVLPDAPIATKAPQIERKFRNETEEDFLREFLLPFAAEQNGTGEVRFVKLFGVPP
jgi:hypothetical protein